MKMADREQGNLRLFRTDAVTFGRITSEIAADLYEHGKGGDITMHAVADDDVVLFLVHGTSAEPLLRDGQVVACDSTHHTTLADFPEDALVAVQTPNGMFLKRCNGDRLENINPKGSEWVLGVVPTMVHYYKVLYGIWDPAHIDKLKAGA